MRVQMGECPIKLHDDKEYEKVKQWGRQVSYVYIKNRTEVRVTLNQNHLSIVALISRDQDYATADIYADAKDDFPDKRAEARKPIIRAGFPHFQGVEGVRATVSAMYATPVDDKKVNSKSKSKAKPSPLFAAMKSIGNATSTTVTAIKKSFTSKPTKK